MPWADADDVATRLGRTLNAAEEAQAEMVIGSVTALVLELLSEDQDWADTLDPVPQTLVLLCIEKAVGTIVNPNNVASESEALGAYQHSHTFPRAADIGIFLSDDEQRRVRRAVGGAPRAVTLASPYPGTETSDLDFWPDGL